MTETAPEPCGNLYIDPLGRQTSIACTRPTGHPHHHSNLAQELVWGTVETITTEVLDVEIETVAGTPTNTLERVAHLLRSATKVRVDRPHEAIRNFANQTLARHAKDGELSLTIEGTAEEIDFLLRFIGGAES